MGIKRSDVRTFVVALAAVAVGTNAPAIAHGVHASFAHNADKVDGIHAATAGAGNKIKKLVATDNAGNLPVSVIPKADADTLDGQDSSAFAGTSHGHSGADISSGEVDEARIDPDIARDSEITAHNHDGAYSPVGHGHSGADINSGTVDAARIDAAIARDSELPTAGSGLTNSGGTFSVNTSQIQTRVTGTCTGSNFVQSILANGTVTCASDPGDISGITTPVGSGLTGGTTSGNAILGVDFFTAQRRVSSPCAAGSSIRAIDSAGAVTCETDDSGPTLAGSGGENGMASTAARSDHTHDARYIRSSPTGPQFISDQLTIGGDFIANSTATFHEPVTITDPLEVRGLMMMGSGAGPAEPSNRGIIVRRIISTDFADGTIVAAADFPGSRSTIQRDGTVGGLKFVADHSFLNIVCTGVTNTGSVLGRAISASTGLSQTIFTHNDGVVFVNCSMGGASFGSESTEITIRREVNPTGDVTWLGSMITTTNQ